MSVLRWTPEKRNRVREQQRARLLKRNYGLTKEAFDQMLSAQNGCCAICLDYMTAPFVDHDHDTNEVRGLLCPNCNFGIGSLRDDPDVLQRAIEYLKKSSLSDVAEA